MDRGTTLLPCIGHLPITLAAEYIHCFIYSLQDTFCKKYLTVFHQSRLAVRPFQAYYFSSMLSFIVRNYTRH